MLVPVADGLGRNAVCWSLLQMVWDETVSVGCGVARVESGSSMSTFTVCHYDPPGNLIGQNAVHVQPYVGTPFIPQFFLELEIENRE